MHLFFKVREVARNIKIFEGTKWVWKKASCPECSAVVWQVTLSLECQLSLRQKEGSGLHSSPEAHGILLFSLAFYCNVCE
jgi:hypothetical protein